MSNYFCDQCDNDGQINKLFKDEIDESEDIYYDTSMNLDNKQINIEEIANDRDSIVKICMTKCCKIFLEVDEEIRNCRDTILKIAGKNGNILCYVSQRFQDDEEIVNLCMDYGWNMFEYASERLKDDETFIYNQIKKKYNCNASIIKFASENIKKNKNIALLAIQKVFWSYEHIHNDLKNDREFIKEALEKDGNIIYLIKNEFRHDDELVYLAIHSTPHAIKYVPEKYKSNKKLAKLALNEKTLEIHENIKNLLETNIQNKGISYDKTTEKRILNQYYEHESHKRHSQGIYIKYLNNDIKYDLDIIECGLRNSYWAYYHLKEDKKNDLEFTTWAIKINSGIYKFIPNEFKSDMNIIDIVLSNYHDIYYYFPDDIKNDKNIIRKAVSTNYDCLQFVDKNILNEEEFIFELMEQINYNVFKYADERIKLNKQLVIRAVEINPLCLQYLTCKLNDNCILEDMKNNNLIDDYDIAIIAINLNINSVKYLSRALKFNKNIKDLIKKIKNNNN